MAHRRNSSLVVPSATIDNGSDGSESTTVIPTATSTAATPSISSAFAESGAASSRSLSFATVTSSTTTTATTSDIPTFSFNVSDEHVHDDASDAGSDLTFTLTPRPAFANLNLHASSNSKNAPNTMAHRSVPPPLPLSSSSSSSSISSFALSSSSSPPTSPPDSPSSPTAAFLPSGFYNQGPLRYTPNPHRRSSSSFSSSMTTTSSSPSSPHANAFTFTFAAGLSGAAGLGGLLRRMRAWTNPASYPPRSVVRRIHASLMSRLGDDAYLPLKSPYPFPVQTFNIPSSGSAKSPNGKGAREVKDKDKNTRSLPPILRRRAQLTVLALFALTLLSIVTLFGSGVNLSSGALPQIGGGKAAGGPASWGLGDDSDRSRLSNSFRLAHAAAVGQPTSHLGDANPNHNADSHTQHRPLPPPIALSPAEELAALVAFMAALPSNSLPQYVDPSQPLDPELVLDFDLRRDKARARSEVQRVVSETWRENPVVVFRSHSALSRRVMSTLSSYGLKPEPAVFDLNTRVDKTILSRVLTRLLASPTTPASSLDETASNPEQSEGESEEETTKQRQKQKTKTIEFPVVLMGGKVVISGREVLVDFVPSVIEKDGESSYDSEGDGGEGSAGGAGGKDGEEGGRVKKVEEMDTEERMDAFLESAELRRLAVEAGSRVVERKKGKGRGRKA